MRATGWPRRGCRAGGEAARTDATDARTLAVDRAEAVRAGVPAPDDDHVLARSADRVAIGDAVAFTAPVLLREVLHGEVHPVQLAARYRQVARLARSAGEDHGVEIAQEGARGHVHTDVTSWS